MAIGIENPTTTQRGNTLGRFVEWRWGLLALWLATSALFLARAIAGHFDRPLPSLGLIAVALIIAGIAVGIRALLHGSLTNSIELPLTSRDWFAQVLPSLAAIFLAVAFTVAGAYVTGMVFLWIIVAVEVLFGAAGPWTLAWLQRLLGREQTDHGTVVLDHLPAARVQKPFVEPLSSELNVDPVEEVEPNDEFPWLWQETTAQQELRYMSLPDTGLCIAGSQRVSLPAAQQTAVVHTVFHPPFGTAPVITIELQEPETVAIKPAQVLPHGVRWELRAEQASDQPCEVRWAFSASCPTDPRG